MEFVVEGTAPQLLSKAEAFMASQGYGIDSRSDTSVTFSRMPPMGGGTRALMFANAFLNPNQAAQDVTAWSNIKWTATLVATPAGEGRTRLAVGGAAGPSRELLQFWVQADLLKEPGTKPMMTLKEAYKLMQEARVALIFNDRIELHAGNYRMRRQGAPITVPDIKEVSVKSRRRSSTWLVESQDGRLIEISGLAPDEADRAKALVEQRIAVYRDEGAIESPIVHEQPEDESAAPPLAADIPGQIRQLAELRDAGILSEDEFQAKKAELLDRM